MLNSFRPFALLLVLIGASAQAVEQLPTREFFKDRQYRTVRIAPDGKHLAVVMPNGDGREMLVFIDLASRKLAGSARFTGSNTVVHDFTWINNERVMIETATKAVGFDDPLLTGDVYGVNFDGSEFKALAGPNIKAYERLESAAMTKRDTVTYYWVLQQRPLPDKPDYALVQAVPASGADWSIRWSVPVAQLMDMRTGRTSQVVRGPAQGGDLYADKYGEVRYGDGWDDARTKKVIFVRSASGGGWQDISGHLKTLGDNYDVQGVGADGHGLYVIGDSAGGRALYEISADGADVKLVAQRAGDDVAYVEWSADDTRAVGVVYSKSNEREYIDASEDRARVLRALGNSFEGSGVDLVHASLDWRLAVVHVADATNDGDYYLFDTASKKAEYLFSHYPELDPELMAEMKPIKFKARDGLDIRGFLTTPKGVEAKQLPMVVLVHGGPHQPDTEDRYGFEPQVQFLANRGYAVLQVNFRGSAGRGPEFVRMGYKRWGREMQDDLTDATRWAIDNGVADPKRICIAGASYGGYAALMGVVREPDLYKCAMGYVGVYDLPLMFGQGDIPESKWGRSYLSLALGTDQADLQARSPVNHADKIKAGIFLVHGGKDERAHPEHYRRMKAALDKAGRPYEELWKLGEGHGFLNVDNKVELYDRLDAFLIKHIGKGAGVP